MTIKRGTVGDGLTEKPTYRWDDTADEADPEVAELLESATLDGMIASTERACFRILEEAGLPGKHGCYAYTKTEWKLPTGGDFLRGWGIANTVEPIAKAWGFAPHSRVGFAAAILDRIYWLRDNQRRGDHDRAALFAFYIGVLKAESRIKEEHEPTWESGKGTREGARKGAEARREQVKARNRVIVDSYQARRGKGQDRPNALRHTAAEFELSTKQISRIVGPE